MRKILISMMVVCCLSGAMVTQAVAKDKCLKISGYKAGQSEVSEGMKKFLSHAVVSMEKGQSNLVIAVEGSADGADNKNNHLGRERAEKMVSTLKNLFPQAKVTIKSQGSSLKPGEVAIWFQSEKASASIAKNESVEKTVTPAIADKAMPAKRVIEAEDFKVASKQNEVAASEAKTVKAIKNEAEVKVASAARGELSEEAMRVEEEALLKKIEAEEAATKNASSETGDQKGIFASLLAMISGSTSAVSEKNSNDGAVATKKVAETPMLTKTEQSVSSEKINPFNHWAIAGYIAVFVIIIAILAWLLRTHRQSSFIEEVDGDDEGDDNAGSDDDESGPSLMDCIIKPAVIVKKGGGDENHESGPSLESEKIDIATTGNIANEDAKAEEEVIFKIDIVGGHYLIPIKKVIDPTRINYLGKFPRVDFISPFTALEGKSVIHESEPLLRRFLCTVVGATSNFKIQLDELIADGVVKYVAEAGQSKSLATTEKKGSEKPAPLLFMVGGKDDMPEVPKVGIATV